MSFAMPDNDFARRTGVHFARLAGLYALYSVWLFFVYYASTPSYLLRFIFVGEASAFWLGALVPLAVFAAAVNRFDLFGEMETRRQDWKWLAAIAGGMCLYIFLATVAWEYVLLLAAPELVRTWPSFSVGRQSVDIAIGIFVVIAGVAGAATGHATQSWSPLRRVAGRWLVAVVLVVSFAAALDHFAYLARMHGYSAGWTVLCAPLLPLLATCALVRACRYGVLEVIGLNRRYANWLDEHAVDRIVTAVVREDQEGGPRAEEVAQTEAELDFARFVRGLRRVAVPMVEVTEAEAREMVARALAEAPPRPAPRSRRLRSKWLEPERLGEFGVAWAFLSVGLTLPGLLQEPGLLWQGVGPYLAPAVTIGLLGAFAHTYLLPRSTAARRPVPVPR